MNWEIVLPAAACFFSVALFWVTMRESGKSKRRRFIGLAIVIPGSIFAAHSLYMAKNPNEARTLEIAPPMPKSFSGTFAAIPLPSSVEQPARIDLSAPDQDLGQIEAAGRSGWWLLDASAGIRDEYRPWVESRFGGLKERTDKQTAPICWRRAPGFPLATGLCSSRQAKYMLDQRPSDIARLADGSATASILKKEKSTVALITHEIPKSDLAQEEACLLALASGRLCAAVEILPGPTMTALSFSTMDAINQQVLEEFGYTLRRDVEQSMHVYDEADLPTVDKQVSMNEVERCRGFVDRATLQVNDLTWMSSTLRSIGTEAELSKELRKLRGMLKCPSLMGLELPSLGMKSARAGVRSLLRQVLDNPIWVTTPSSYMYRARRTAKVELGLNPQNSHLWIRSPEKIRKLSLTLVTPNSFPEEILVHMTIGGTSGAWRVYHVDPVALRVVLDNALGTAWIDLHEFTASLTRPQLRMTAFLGTTGVVPSLLLAYVLAGLLAFVQAASPGAERRGHWSLTFIPVAFVSFILVFVSYYYARKPAGGEPSVLAIENPPMPAHVFLREWPDDWFVPPPVPMAAASAPNPSISSARWTKVLGDVQNKVKEQSQSGGPSTRATSSYLGVEPGQSRMVDARPVVIWDNPRARNFYFRRSPSYQTTLLSWRALGAQQSPRWNVIEGSELTKGDLPARGILVIPDLVFASAQDVGLIQSFVSEGGVLVFSERIAGENTVASNIPSEGPFAEAMRNAGAGRGRKSFYSQVAITGLALDGLNSLHNTVDGEWLRGASFGSGAVVFLGAQPLDSQSQLAAMTILRRLQGERVVVDEPGPGCATALFIAPFGPKEQLTALASQLSSQGLDVKWQVDPVSFSRMIATWGPQFRSDGVAYTDDGTAATRFTAEGLWKEFIGKDGSSRMMFASSKRGAPGLLEGPAGDLYPVQTLTGDKNATVQRWISECRLGFAQPRLLPGGQSAEDIKEWGEVIKRLGKGSTLKLAEYGKRASASNSGGGAKRELRYRLDSPLLFE